MISKEKFESVLLNDEFMDYFSSKSKEDLEQEFGPIIARMYGFDQKNSHHMYDLMGHTLHTVEGIKKEGLTDDEYKALRVAAFFHDIGKPDVVGINRKNGEQTFYNHATHSVGIAKPILEQLGYSKEEIDRISFFIGHHDDFINYKTSIEPGMEHHEYIRKIDFVSVTEKVLENMYDFEKMGYNKDEIRAIVYTLSHGEEPLFLNYKKEPIQIFINIDDVMLKMKSGEYNRDFQPSQKEYALLLKLCRADAGAQAIETRAGKIENFDSIENTLEQAFELVNSVRDVSEEIGIQDLSMEQDSEKHVYTSQDIGKVADVFTSNQLIHTVQEIIEGKDRKQGEKKGTTQAD